MKPQEIDQLFREKLVTHSETPKQAGWQQLNDRLQQNKKRKGMVYWRVAAAVLLLLSAIGFLLYSPATSERTIAEAEQAKPAIGTEAEQIQEDNTTVMPLEIPEEAIAQQQPEQAKQQTETKVEDPVQEAIRPQHSPQLAVQEKEKMHQIPSAGTTETAEAALPNLNTLDTQALALETEAPIVDPEPLLQQEIQEQVIIEYKPAGRKKVTLLAASLPAENTQEESGSKVSKLLKKVKNTEIDLISLREAKNELIASRLQP